MNAASITPDIQKLIKSASKKLKGSDKRQFIAEVAESLCGNSPRLAETLFGFCRHAVQLGIHERRTGLICYGAYQDNGRKKAEVLKPELEADIRALVDPESQADPQLRNTFAYTRITTRSLRQQLMDIKGWQDEQLPKERTLNDILNRLGYKLRKVQKTKPQKKFRKPMPSSKMSTV